jgi:hypothetical protein
MIYTSENNWYKWKYGVTGDWFGRNDLNSKFITSYSCGFDRDVGTFKEELYKAASSTLDFYPGLKPCVFFSGGVDSELILRSYIDIGADPLAYIVRYEDDINAYDVNMAVTVCKLLNVKYRIIDFNLKTFFENDAESIAAEAQIDRPRMLPHLKFTECADGLIIVGHSDVRWYRVDGDYTKKGVWLAQDFEHDIGCDKYNILHNRAAIFQWWKWTPGLVISLTNLNWFKKLVNDGYHKKEGINSTKLIGFKEAFPDLISRTKYTGFENVEPLITEFENFLKIKFNGLPYRGTIDRSIDQLINEIKLSN